MSLMRNPIPQLVGALLLLAHPGLAGEPRKLPAPMATAQWRQHLATMPAGDPGRGEKLHHSLFCASCHGDQGIAPTANWPHLAGQKPIATFKALLDYQQGIRSGTESADLMKDASEGVTIQNMADLAAFYARQHLNVDLERNPLPLAQVLVRRGDSKRLITPCASCHGAAGQGGRFEAGSLAGQHPGYLEEALKAFQSGARRSDLQGSMRQPSSRLSPEEIQSLASYFSGLPRRK